MTHTAKYIAVGLTVIALVGSYGTVVPAAEASWETRVVAHYPTSPSSGQEAPTTENVTTDVAAECIDSESIGTDVPITDSIDEGETKRYEFAAEAGQVIRIVHNDIFEPANLTLSDPDGEVIARDTTRSKYRYPFGAIAEQSGTYMLDVRSENTTTYQFRVDTRNPDYVSPYENASNDDRQTALEIDEKVANLTGVLAEGEEDWYAVSLDGGDRLDVTLSHDLACPQDGAFPFDLGNGMQVDVLDANGQDVGQLDFPAKSTGSDWSEYDDARQTALASAAGTYYVRISNSSHMGGFADYEMTIEVTEAETQTST